MMDNIFIRTDPAGNIKADKEKSTEKIDGAVATIMALDRAIRCGNDNGESVYDKRGFYLFNINVPIFKSIARNYCHYAEKWYSPIDEVKKPADVSYIYH